MEPKSMDTGTGKPTAKPILDWLRRNGMVLVVYVLATWFTKPWMMGDTVDYVDSILSYHYGHYLEFWEFGHLLWRPIGWLVFKLFSPLTNMIFGADDRAKVTVTLLAINWVASLACLLLLRALITRVCDREWLVNFSTIGFLFTSAFLNYGQTGSAYVPGLALILLGAWILLRNSERATQSKLSAALAGLAFAGGVCLWVPSVLLLPAALSLPLLLVGWDKSNLQSVFFSGLAFCLGALFAYAAVIIILRINNVADLREWVTSANHGMTGMRGVPRMVFGFSNSLIDLGGDGALFKRYLKHDPFNPAPLSALIRASLSKLVFAYAFLLCMVVNLLRLERGKRILALLVIDILPTIVFALFIFEAGDMSRYIVVLPLIFLGVAFSLCSERALPWAKYVMIVFIGVSIVTNVTAMAASTLSRREQRVESRIKDLLPLLKPNSRVVTSHLQDEINNFTRDFLFNPINRNGNLRYYAVLVVNTDQVEHWRQDFASMALSVWKDGGDLWVSKRLLTPVPKPEWNWVEGDDPRLSWTDLYGFFSPLQMGQSVSGEDGFIILPPSPRNKDVLTRIAQGEGSNAH